MDNNLTITTACVCRTCMEEIINTSFFHLDFTQVDSEPTIGQKLSNCIPELDLSILPNTVICCKCADTINSLYIFKEECLQLEMNIHEYNQQVQHTDSVTDLAAVMQFHQLHSKSLTAELKTEAFEKTENYKNEESSTSFCNNYAFNETERYTEIANKEYLTSLQMVDRQCVVFNDVGNFINSDQSEAEENSDTHDNSNVQDCLLQDVENPNSCIQNLNKNNIYYQCFTCGQKSESKLKLIQHLKSHTNTDNKLYQKEIPSKVHRSWYRCGLCNYSTKHKCLFSFHYRAHLTKKNYQKMLVKPSTNTVSFSKKDNKDSKIKCGSHMSNKHNFKLLSKYSKFKQQSKQCNISKVKMGTNITVSPFKCEICDFSCKIHMRIHIRDEPFKCTVCDYSSKCKSNLKYHMLTHAGEKLFKCSICEYSSYQKNNLMGHMQTHAHENPYKCSVCDYSCKRKCNLKNHMLTHTDERPFKCSICDYSSNQKFNLKNHILIHTKGNLKSNLPTHTDEKPFKCSVCEYSCNHKSRLKIHVLTHTGEKQFKCSVCKHSFSTKGCLKSHMLTHTGEKPFKCYVCEYSFKSKNTLKLHILTHTGEKPIKCPICKYRCIQKNNLKIHMLSHANIKLFKCSVCEYTCNRKGNLQKHMLTHTDEKQFRCSVSKHDVRRKDRSKE